MAQKSTMEKAKDFVIDLGVGGISASVSKTVVAPIERVKLMLQGQAANAQIPVDKRYKGITDCFKRTYAEQGLASFWRGNFTNVLRYFPTQALNFAFNAKYKQLFIRCKREENFGLWFSGLLAAGGAAGATSMLAVYPLDLARTLLSNDTGVGKDKLYKGLGDCLVKTVRNEGGIMSLYKGFGISVAGIIPYRALYFGCFEALQSQFSGQKTFFVNWGIAQVTTTFAQYCSYPIDTIRRRLMMRGGGKNALYNGTIDCFRKIVRDEGFLALYHGAWANTLRATGGALCMVFYKEIKKNMEAGKKEQPANKR